MTQVKKYRLGNQPEEYELHEGFVGFKPVDFDKLDHVVYNVETPNWRELPVVCKLVSADGKEEVSLIVHELLGLEEFPFSYCAAELLEKWKLLLKVAHENNPLKQFMIPLP